MTIAPPTVAPPETAARGFIARIDIAWTVSARSAGAGRTYASAVLRVEAEWESLESAPPGDAMCPRCSVVAGARVTAIPLPPGLHGVVATTRGHWAHVTVRAGADVVLRASFEQGRLVYCTSAIPACAGFGGATYDAPTGTLDLYPAALHCS